MGLFFGVLINICMPPPSTASPRAFTHSTYSLHRRQHHHAAPLSHIVFPLIILQSRRFSHVNATASTTTIQHRRWSELFRPLGHFSLRASLGSYLNPGRLTAITEWFINSLKGSQQFRPLAPLTRYCLLRLKTRICYCHYGFPGAF